MKHRLELIALAIACASLGAASASAQPPMTPEAGFEAMTRDPAAAEMFAALRESYPAEFARFRELVLDAARRNLSEREGFVIGYRFMSAFVASKVDAITGAPAADLVGLARNTLELIDAMRTHSVALCARFGIAGLSENDSAPLPANIERLMAGLSARMIRAARNGEDRGGQSRGPATQELMGAWIAELRRADAAAVAVLASPEALAAASPERQCGVARSLYAAMLALPDRQSAAIMAHAIRHQLARSAAADAPQ